MRTRGPLLCTLFSHFPDWTCRGNRQFLTKRAMDQFVLVFATLALGAFVLVVGYIANRHRSSSTTSKKSELIFFRGMKNRGEFSPIFSPFFGGFFGGGNRRDVWGDNFLRLETRLNVWDGKLVRGEARGFRGGKFEFRGSMGLAYFELRNLIFCDYGTFCSTDLRE